MVRIEVDGVNDVSGIELPVGPGDARPGTGTIDGVVLDPKGVPAPSVRVEACQSNDPRRTAGTTSRDDGTFTVKRLKATPYDLRVSSPLGKGQLRRISPGAKVTIQLNPPTSVTGIVVTGSIPEGVS